MFFQGFDKKFPVFFGKPDVQFIRGFPEYVFPGEAGNLGKSIVHINNQSIG